MTTSRVQRGDIWWIDFEPAQGSEVHKVRPAVVLSNDVACRVQDRVQVVPVTSNVARIYTWEAAINVSGRKCKAMADQIKTVAKGRIKGKIGAASANEMSDIEAAVCIQLGLRAR